jgi:hypothetical protein
MYGFYSSWKQGDVVGIGDKGLYNFFDLKTKKLHALIVVENTNVL